jgi:hypothetical protein
MENTTNSIPQLRLPEYRERVVDAILEMLADLPEMQRDLFISSHYKGHDIGKIAEILGWENREVETALDTVNAIRYGKTRELLANKHQMERGTKPSTSVHTRSPLYSISQA